MDRAQSINLSKALSALHLVSAKWATIDLGPGWGFSLDNDPNLIAVHFVLDGVLEVSCTHDEPQVFAAGQSFILPNGAGHVVRTGSGAKLSRLGHVGAQEDEALSAFEGEDSPVHLMFGTSRTGRPAATVLSGQIGLTWPEDLLPPRALLPKLIVGSPGYRLNSPSAEEAVRSLREMADAPGGTICLARFAHLLVTRRLREQLLQEPELVSANPRSSVAIARVVQSIRMEPGRAWSVASLARHAGMSRSGFAEKFRQETGRTPMEVVSAARMDMAARLLRRSREPIKAISASTGYSSSTAFIRTFRRHFGQSPTDFREQSGQD
ncbi:AraC family transcriptional regulator [Novosphingobium pentaromativorans]|uniref:HTH araC/xylS-type domain-containing protein n=1 Tax=Novosphingobium pentaromativorans US6-1 TaxID=1088721 RepID=G6ECK4_9SPHN|nr:AraC family transcriptional regulator [Novosphingobium pentaromativorans]EHJ60915.1 hypothetical protein NSU_2075 [Novosphingobium pentaromativorans US6-1]